MEKNQVTNNFIEKYRTVIKEKNEKVNELEEAIPEMIKLSRLIFQDGEAQYLEKSGILVHL